MFNSIGLIPIPSIIYGIIIYQTSDKSFSVGTVNSFHLLVMGFTAVFCFNHFSNPHMHLTMTCSEKKEKENFISKIQSRGFLVSKSLKGYPNLQSTFKEIEDIEKRSFEGKFERLDFVITTFSSANAIKKLRIQELYIGVATSGVILQGLDVKNYLVIVGYVLYFFIHTTSLVRWSHAVLSAAPDQLADSRLQPRRLPEEQPLAALRYQDSLRVLPHIRCAALRLHLPRPW